MKVVLIILILTVLVWYPWKGGRDDYRRTR